MSNHLCFPLVVRVGHFFLGVGHFGKFGWALFAHCPLLVSVLTQTRLGWVRIHARGVLPGMGPARGF
mgnify:CR=1 FL=1